MYNRATLMVTMCAEWNPVTSCPVL